MGVRMDEDSYIELGDLIKYAANDNWHPIVRHTMETMKPVRKKKRKPRTKPR